jgi:hypothetical protein
MAMFQQSSGSMHLTRSRNTVQKVDVAQRVDEVAFLVYEYTAAPPEEQNDRGPHSSFESTEKLQRWATWRLLTIAQVLE